MIGFRAHKNHADQTNFVAGQYALLSFPAVAVNAGGRFSDSGWSPVLPHEPARLVQLGGQIWVRAGATGNPVNYVAKIIKNGNPGGLQVTAGIGVAGTFPDSVVIPMPLTVDLAQPGDVYRLYLYVTNPAAVVDGHPAHTWWSGRE